MTDDDDFKHARRDDPETSHEAAEFERTRDRKIVHACLHAAGAHGLADFELDQRLGGSFNGKWRKRRSDLTDDGVVVWNKEHRTNPMTGKRQRVWILKLFAPVEAEPAPPPAQFKDDLFS
jgi:hypothetical protein